MLRPAVVLVPPGRLFVRLPVALFVLVLTEAAGRAAGFRRRVAETVGLGHGLVEVAQRLIAQRGALLARLVRQLVRNRVADRFRLDLADRLFQRQPLAGDFGLVERGIDTTQLIDQRRARALVQRPAILARVVLEAGDGAGDQGLVISHRCSTLPRMMSFFGNHVSKGFFIRIVSSRSGLVESKVTGQPISSSTRRTYLIACAGSCAQDRAQAVGSFQPSMVS